MRMEGKTAITLQIKPVQMYQSVHHHISNKHGRVGHFYTWKTRQAADNEPFKHFGI